MGARVKSALVLLAFAPVLLYVATSSAALVSRVDPEQQLLSATVSTLRRNVHLRVPVVYPSPAYSNPYLRDSFWTSAAIGDRSFAIGVLNHFVTAIDRSGNPPTFFVHAYRSPVYHADESAAILLIWSYRNKTLYHVSPPKDILGKTLRYLLARSTKGYLNTPAGPFGGWWDAYSFPRSSTLAYSQGLYAVALMCAQRLGLSISARSIDQAQSAYRSLYVPRLGYLPVSTALPASDASALTGEFLSLWILRHAILTDSIVISTLRHLTPFASGFRVVALPRDGLNQSSGYLPDGLAGIAGDYQNGASWLLYDAITIAAAGLHGLPGALSLLQARLELEFRQGAVFHEYLQTNPALPHYGSEPSARDYFSWDTFVVVIDRLLQSHTGRSHAR